MKKTILGLAALTFAIGVCADFTETFDGAWNADRFPAHRDLPALSREGGTENSPCAVFQYNGRHLLIPIPELTTTPVTLTAKVRLETEQAFLRVAFGPESIAWNFSYGAVDIKPDGNPDAWRTVQLIVTPNSEKSGSYQVLIDGRAVGSGTYNAAKGPVCRFRIAYLSQKADGKIFLDDLSFRTFGAAAAAVPGSAADFTESFSGALDFNRFPAHRDLPALSREGGTENSPCAVFQYNGRHLLIPIPELTTRPVTLTAKVRLETEKAFLRVAFGPESITWNFSYGAVDIKPDGNPDVWHTVRLIVTPNPVKPGRYQVLIDGKTVGSGTFTADKGPVCRFRIAYLSQKADGKIFLDDLSVRTGEPQKLPPQESVTFQLPPPERRVVTGDAVELPFALIGDRNAALKNFRAEVFPLGKNFFREAEKTPVGCAALEFNGPAEGSVRIAALPFGLHVLRISAEDADGRRHVLKEEYLCRKHPAPRPAAPFPIRWAITSHCDRPAHWKQELEALAEAGANWTRLELNLNSVTPKTEKTIRFDHHDRVVERGGELGINFFLCINCKPKWSGITPQSDDGCLPDLANWELACRMVMEHFKGKIFFYEIGNEVQHYNWNHFEPGVTNERHYAEMLKTARRVAAGISPDIRVFGPSATGNMTEWLITIAEAGGFDDAEYVSYHDNSLPDWRGQFYLRLIESLTGKKLKLFDSEGSNDLRRLIASFAGETPSAAFAYVMLDKGISENNYEHFNGMMRLDGIPKNRFVQYQYIANLLTRSEYLGRIFTTDGIRGYLFREHGALTAVCWAGESDRLPQLAFAPGVERFDLLGNPFEGDRLERIFGSYYYDAPPRLICVMRNLPADSPDVLAASVNWNGDEQLFDREVQKLAVTFRNDGPEERRCTLKFAPTAGIVPPRELAATVPAGAAATREIDLRTTPDAPAEEIFIDAEFTADGKTVPRRFGPVRVLNPERVKTVALWRNPEENPLTLPVELEDIHRNLSTGVARDVQNQQQATEGSSFETVTVPGTDHPVARLNYVFRRPVKGWLPSIWLARRYRFKEPVPLPGIPMKLSYRVFMENNTEGYPTVPIFTFDDPSGKEIRIEGANIFFTGWRKMECFLPSLYTSGHIHSVSGGNNLKAVDAYPLKWTGIILNLIPLSSSVHAPENLPAVRGSLLFDDARVTFYDDRK